MLSEENSSILGGFAIIQAVAEARSKKTRYVTINSRVLNSAKEFRLA